MKLRFAMIDVKKTQKALSAKKIKEQEVNIHNEIKIITASDDVYNLWSELISCQSQGELMDPETGLKNKDLKNWNAERDGVITREFFKWLGNLSEAQLKRFAEHLLNKPDPKREEPYPKVTMKKITAVMTNCYSAKDWLERCKRKQIVRRQLHLMKPSLGLFSSSGDFKKESWKRFKKNYKITRAALNVLLSAPGEDYFTAAKLPCNKNKSIFELSPYAEEFFRVFLANKGKFVIPKGKANYRPYNLDNDVLSPWSDDAWNEHTAKRLKLGIMDFRNLPGALEQAGSSSAAPYFYNFLQVLEQIEDPSVTELPVWIWICRDRDSQAKIVHHVSHSKFGELYNSHYAEYVPGKYERLEDQPSNSKRAQTNVQIIYMFKKGFRPKIRSLPKVFEAPFTAVFTTPGGYNELDYRMYNTELRMEFYLQLLDLFCRDGDAILTVFGGGKLTCAAWVIPKLWFFISSRHQLNSSRVNQSSREHYSLINKLSSSRVKLSMNIRSLSQHL